MNKFFEVLVKAGGFYAGTNHNSDDKQVIKGSGSSDKTLDIQPSNNKNIRAGQLNFLPASTQQVIDIPAPTGGPRQ